MNILLINRTIHMLDFSIGEDESKIIVIVTEPKSNEWNLTQADLDLLHVMIISPD